MQITSFIVIRKYKLTNMFVLLCVVIIGGSNFVVADSLSYSPDQWPRHWNVLMNKTNLQERLDGYRANRQHINNAPARSPMWGVVPSVKNKSRRSMRPEYNTNSHMQNYYGQNIYRGNYFPGFSSYGFQTPYVVPLMNPYGVSALAPGLAAPGIPFGAYPLMGGLPGMGYMW